MSLDALTKCMSPKQIISLADCTQKKISLWSGAVSAGKTYVSLYAFLFAILDAPTTGRIIIVGRTIDTIQTNLMTLLTDPAIFGEYTKYIKYTPGAKTASILGRTVYLYGANDATSETKIRGMTVALAYVDEATIIPEGFWDMLITRLRVKGARCMATTNPGSKNHWLRKKWLLEANDRNLVHFTFTMDDNPSLEQDYIDDMKRSYSGVFYKRMIQGLWTNAAGAVYDMWDEDRHVLDYTKLPVMQKILATSLDYGTTNTTAALKLGLSLEARPRLVLFDEWGYNSRENLGVRLPDMELSKRLRAWDKTQPPSQFWFLDPSAASLAEQLRHDGQPTWLADNDVMGGIQDVSNLLANDRLVVSSRCKGWISEATEYEWSSKASEAGLDEVVKLNDHYMDAGRYGIRSTAGQWGHLLLEP